MGVENDVITMINCALIIHNRFFLALRETNGINSSENCKNIRHEGENTSALPLVSPQNHIKLNHFRLFESVSGE